MGRCDRSSTFSLHLQTSFLRSGRTSRVELKAHPSEMSQPQRSCQLRIQRRRSVMALRKEEGWKELCTVRDNRYLLWLDASKLGKFAEEPQASKVLNKAAQDGAELQAVCQCDFEHHSNSACFAPMAGKPPSPCQRRWVTMTATSACNLVPLLEPSKSQKPSNCCESSDINVSCC